MSTWVLPLLLGLLVVGCGGGGSGSSAPATGFVTVLVGDKPIDDLSAVWLRVREVEFNMTGGKKHVFVGMDESINLLELTNLTEALMLSEEIVTGKVTKIRLLLDDLAIERNGSPVNADREVVPAGGWIELNPQGPFEVRAGETIYVMIDFPWTILSCTWSRRAPMNTGSDPKSLQRSTRMALRLGWFG
jgi:hypothetical protein